MQMVFLLAKRTQWYILRRYATANKKVITFFEGNSNATVIHSESHCPFENLAFEDYLYENVSFEGNKKILFLWRNANTVVIGRHQNIWKEVHLGKVNKNKVSICRRKSGGGTVFHDLGNLNLTFFTDRQGYDRKRNLDYIIKTLKDLHGKNLSRNEKDDIIFNDNLKVSGTAAKLGLRTAYHHCTLLCNTNMDAMSGVLKRSFGEIETNATGSVPSETANLFGEDFDYHSLCKGFSSSYFVDENTSGKELHVLPSDVAPIDKKVKELKHWDWIFGKSPKFTFSMSLNMGYENRYKISLVVAKGIITKADLNCEIEFEEIQEINSIVRKLIGVRFEYEDVEKTIGLSGDTETQILRYFQGF